MNESIYENYVQHIVKEGNLTKAAEGIGISQPALSSGLSVLEKKLGFRIFDRSCNPVQLTEEGHIYFMYLKQKNALTADFETRIKAHQGNRDNHAVIGAPVVYSDSIVAESVCLLLEKYPDYNISIITAPLNRLIELAEDGKLDCFISTSEKIPREFMSRIIKQERLFLCVPKKYAISTFFEKYTNRPLNIAEISRLKNENFIFLEKNQPIQLLVEETFAKFDFILKNQITVNQVSVAVHLAAKGVGCCFASEDALIMPSIREQLVICPLSFIPSRSLFVVRHRDFYQTVACRNLISELYEVCKIKKKGDNK